MSDALPRVGSALLVRDEANRILLGKRNKDPQRGSWVIPGGRIEAFETIADAAAREIQEETGLIVEVRDQFGVYEIINPPNEHRLIIYSWGTLMGGTPKASDDLSEVKFFTLDELGQVPTTPLVRRVLADAGLILGEAQPLRRRQVQLNLFLVPIPIAGTNERGRSRVRARSQVPRRPRSRVRRINNSPLLFDSSLLS
jgi:8-oxo-dGTP diphosphatase